MKVVILSKSDGTGGAAIVSYRLMEALRAEGVDARMLVAEKTTESPFVREAFSPLLRKYEFLRERLSIYCKNGFDRNTLFKIDDGSRGLPLWRHPWIEDADAVIINWVNQAFLSLSGVKKLAEAGKKILWTMHDMWNFTGICHHAGSCRKFTGECGDCPLLHKGAAPDDMSHRVWKRKAALYGSTPITFVAVSSWLKNLAEKSSLLSTQKVELIPNAFPISSQTYTPQKGNGEKVILFGAARIDDPIKGFPILKDALKKFSEKYPELASCSKLVVYGNVKNPETLKDIAIESEYIGVVKGMDELKDLYGRGAVVASTSLYENLPGTLIEGQAFGCVPVSFDRGGQRDIIAHLHTGYLVAWNDDSSLRAEAFADGLAWALQNRESLIEKMFRSVDLKFSYGAVARRYISLLS